MDKKRFNTEASKALISACQLAGIVDKLSNRKIKRSDTVDLTLKNFADQHLKNIIIFLNDIQGECL